MNERTLDILDQSLTLSLWIFLVIFTVILLFANQRLNALKQDLLECHLEEQYKTTQQNNTLRFLPNQTRVIFQTLFLSLGIASLAFILLSLLPINNFKNFASSTSSQDIPLRVTSLHHNRFYKGFSLLGKVWNQTQKPIPNLQAIVSIWQSDQGLLDTVSIPVVPSPVPSDSVGTFKLRYEKHSPSLYGYRLSFKNLEGEPIPHLEGFDVE